MNYYNPYYYNMSVFPFNTTSRMGLLKNTFKKINFSNILNTTQKTLNIVNQTIPLIKQARPIISNAKTMFKVLNEFKKDDKQPSDYNKIKKIEPSSSYNEGPTFFL